MAADLGLVMHAAQRHALKRAPGRFGDRSAKRGLAHTGRADKAQDRTLTVGIQLAHCKEFEDAALDLVEAEMVFVENAARLPEIDRRRRVLLPRQFGQQFEISAQHRGLGRVLTHACVAFEFLAHVFERLVGHARRFDLTVEFRELLSALLALAEFFLDLTQLFTQHMLALMLVEFLTGLVTDLFRQTQDLDARAERGQHAVEPRGEVEGFEDGLLFLILDVEKARDHVRQRAGGIHVLDHALQLVGRIGQ